MPRKLHVDDCSRGPKCLDLARQTTLILSMTVVPFPDFSVMQICISMLQCFRFGPWEPGNEVKYTARLARTIDVINACESKIESKCVCLMQNA